MWSVDQFIEAGPSLIKHYCWETFRNVMSIGGVSVGYQPLCRNQAEPPKPLLLRPVPYLLYSTSLVIRVQVRESN